MGSRCYHAGLLVLLLTLAGTGMAEGLCDVAILNRADRRNFLTRTTFHVYVISNLPREVVMPAVCREALSRRGHCKYLPLNAVGKFGSQQRELLPYNAGKNTETVVVADRSTLTAEERAGLEKLRKTLYPTAPAAEVGQALIWVQNRGTTGREYQVLLDLPAPRWLTTMADDLWAIPRERIADNSHDACALINRVSATAILCNDNESGARLAGGLRYSDTRLFHPRELTAFRDATGIDRRIIALNWNGDQECAPAMLACVLPEALHAVTAEHTRDRMGLTGWQRFCRQAMARQYPDGTSATWVIGAPTAKILRALATTVVQNGYSGGPFSLPICDLSYINSLAVGAYLASPDPDRNRLVLQQQMEEIVQDTLGSRVRSMVSTLHWGSILDQALERNPAMDDPFRLPESRQLLNQATQTDAVLLLWVKELTPQVIFSFPRERVTPPYAPFTETAPSRPREPHPDDRTFGIFGHRTYPGRTSEERRNSEEFQDDWNDWRYTEMPEWEREHSRWEYRRKSWEDGRSAYPVIYNYTVTCTPKVGLVGHLRVIDQIDPQRLLWNNEVLWSRTGATRIMRTLSVQVCGESTDPPLPREASQYANQFTWQGGARAIGDDALYAIGQQALLDALRDAVARLAEAALLSGDLKSWNQPHIEQ